MKKTLSLLLAFIMLTLSLPVCAFAEEDEESPIIWLQTLEIEITDNKELAEAGDTVTVYVAASDNVAIEDFVIVLESASKSTRTVRKMTRYGDTDYYYTVFSVTEDTEAGYWNIPQMKVTDPSGHYMYVTNLRSYTFGVKGTILESDIAFKNGDTYVYSPSGVKPHVVVTNKGVTLTEGTDYTVKYSDNFNVGTGVVTVTGKGCFGGKHSKEFTIVPQTRFSVKLSNNTYIYNGKVKRPAVTVYDGDSVVDASNYTVKYSEGRKNVGKYPITVTMKNNYSGTKTAHIVIKPQGTPITKITAKKSSATVIWKKQTVQTTGYQLQYSTDSSFKKAVKSVILSKGKTKRTVKSLKKGKTYYFRIRTYTKVDGRTIYSKWSKTKK